jgi:hypothetical protein
LIFEEAILCILVASQNLGAFIPILPYENINKTPPKSPGTYKRRLEESGLKQG